VHRREVAVEGPHWNLHPPTDGGRHGIHKGDGMVGESLQKLRAQQVAANIRIDQRRTLENLGQTLPRVVAPSRLRTSV
jgi:hypothetical protein